MEDVKALVEKLAGALQKDGSLKEKFQKDPVSTVKTLAGELGAKVPDGMMDKLVDGVKAKLGMDKLSGAAEKLKKLF